MADVEARVALTTLLDFYGPLLTQHRREVAALYCEEDLSLGEIAEQIGITRQGVSDALQKARRQLEDYEAKLGLVARYKQITEAARRGIDALADIEPHGESDEEALRAARAAMEKILRIER